jgi:hypothetical protein
MTHSDAWDESLSDPRLFSRVTSAESRSLCYKPEAPAKEWPLLALRVFTEGG